MLDGVPEAVAIGATSLEGAGVSTVIPEAFEEAREYTGLVTAAGFLGASVP